MARELRNYVTQKVQILRELGHKEVTREMFTNANNEIQVDNIAHGIIISK